MISTQVTRDVRSLSKSHLEGAPGAWRRWWGPQRAATEIANATAIAAAALPARDGCGRVFAGAVAWRLVFCRFWADEQRALLDAGAALGADRYRLARAEDLAGATDRNAGGARVADLLAWVGAAPPDDAADLWRRVFEGHGTAYARPLPVVDAILSAAFGIRGVVVDAGGQSLSLSPRSAVLDFLVDAGIVPAGNAPPATWRADFGVSFPAGLAARVHERHRVHARLAIVAAVKAHGPARGARADALQAAEPRVRAALLALGYPADRGRAAPSAFLDKRASARRRRALLAGRDVSHHIFDAVKAKCVGAT